jgi:hypothetical protein
MAEIRENFVEGFVISNLPGVAQLVGVAMDSRVPQVLCNKHLVSTAPSLREELDREGTCSPRRDESGNVRLVLGPKKALPRTDAVTAQEALRRGAVLAYPAIHTLVPETRDMAQAFADVTGMPVFATGIQVPQFSRGCFVGRGPGLVLQLDGTWPGRLLKQTPDSGVATRIHERIVPGDLVLIPEGWRLAFETEPTELLLVFFALLPKDTDEALAVWPA